IRLVPRIAEGIVGVIVLYLAVVNLIYGLGTAGKALIFEPVSWLQKPRNAVVVLGAVAALYVAARASAYLGFGDPVAAAGELVHPPRLNALVASVADFKERYGPIAAVVIYLVVNLMVALRRADRATLKAITDTMPPALWLMWFLQFSVTFA